MTNFEAIIQMDAAKLEIFLRNVYLTGLNTGLCAAAMEEARQEAVPYDIGWQDGIDLLECQIAEVQDEIIHRMQ